MKKTKTTTPKPVAPPTGLAVDMIRLETPDGFGYIQATPGNIDVISARTFYVGRGRPTDKKPVESGQPGRWVVTRSGNKLFVLSTIENRQALGLPEE